MVAPSFQKYTFMSEPYDKNNKKYIDVKHPSTGNIRSVRWYSEKEYAKLYQVKVEKWDMKHARGFDKGYIHVIRGITSATESIVRSSCARWAAGIGWYIVSTDPIPADFPSSLSLLLLTWEEFKIDDQRFKDEKTLAAIISKKEREMKDECKKG